MRGLPLAATAVKLQEQSAIAPPAR